MLSTISSALYTIYEIEMLFIRIAIIMCDVIGATVLMITVFKSLYYYVRKDRHVKLMLAQGIALALEFKLAAEVLKTVTIRDWNELFILGTIIVLRIAITLLIHWEIKSEKAEHAQELDGETKTVVSDK